MGNFNDLTSTTYPGLQRVVFIGETNGKKSSRRSDGIPLTHEVVRISLETMSHKKE